MEICPESINITHSGATQTRHIIIRNISNSALTFSVTPPKGIPCLRLLPPDKYLLDSRAGRLLLSLPPSERVVLRLVYSPDENQTLGEDAVVLFNELSPDPILVRIACLPAAQVNWSPCALSQLSLDLGFPPELGRQDSDSDGASTYLEGTGWVNDYGEVLTRRSGSQRDSKRQVTSNWESLKRSCN